MEVEKRKLKKNINQRNQRVRIITLLILIELSFVFLIYRLVSLQYIRSDEFKQKAEVQHQKSVKIRAKRGNVYDTKYRPLAINVKSYSLYMDPSIVHDEKSIIQTLSDILDITPKDILLKLDPNKRFVWIKRQLPDNVAEKIRSLGYNCLGFEEEEKRFYPKGSLAAHIIGFVGLDNVGLEGIEKVFDNNIRGNLKKIITQKDRMGRDLKPKDLNYDEDTHGCDIVLTIDEVIQHIAENELRSACEKWNADGGSVIIMNPKTGEILALANYPTYDLNKAFSTDKNPKRNRALIDLYEPGSVFKIITASALINENLVDINESINCENGEYNFDGRVIHDSSRYRSLTFSEVIEKSSNIGMIKAARRLDKDTLYKYIKAFGLCDKTGVELPEITGSIRSPRYWTKHSMSAIPFGQEISVNSLQMLCAFNAIANDGIIMKPSIVKSIMYGNKSIKEFTPKEAGQPISSNTARIMRSILIKTVENGTARNAKIDGYKVAGKTGTSQKASQQYRGYAYGKYISSFAGFLPADDPFISMIIVIDEPKGSYYAGDIACPVFNTIATQVIQYLTVGQGIEVAVNF